MHQLFKYCISLPLEFAVILMIGVFGGYFLDGQWGTEPIFALIGSLLGLGVGLYHLVKTTSRLNS